MQGYTDTLGRRARTSAGIATQNVVERALRKERLDRETLGREKFVQRVWNGAASSMAAPSSGN